MKVLLMAPLWGMFGGKEQYILTCIEELTRMGHDCSLVYGCDSLRPGQTRLPPIRKYKISAYSEIRSAKGGIATEQLAQVLRAETPDVIFMTDVKSLDLLNLLKTYGGLVPMSHDHSLTCLRGTCTTYLRRTICTHPCDYRCLLHGCFLKRNPTGKGLIYKSVSQQRMLLESYKEIDTHLVASTYMKERLVQHGFSPDQVRVVGYFTEMAPSSKTLSTDSSLEITFMGRVDRLKGVDYLMRALALISIPFRCSIIGEGDYLPYCKKLCCQLGLADRIDFLGWLSRDRLTERLSSSSMLVVPSIWPEPFGIVGLEAMTRSKPVVAFDVGGIKDWLRDGINGYLVPPKNARLLAEKIEELLRDRQKAARMGIEGYRIVRNKFSKDLHFNRLMTEFERAASVRRKVVI